MRPLGIARTLSLAFAAIAIIPLSVALASSISILLGQARMVESEVLWGKVKLAKLAYEERREGLSRALDAASHDNAILVNLELGLDSALSDALADLVHGESLDGAWVAGPEGRAIASQGQGSPFEEGTHQAARAYLTSIEIAASPGGAAFLAGTRRLVSGTGKTVGYIGASVGLGRLCAEASEASNTPAFFILGSGEWVFSSGSEAAGLASPAVPAPRPRLSDSGGSLGAIGAIGGVRYLLSFVPVPEGGEAARLGVAYPAAKLTGPRDRGVAAILASGLLALALAGFGGLYFRRRITLPVLSLAGAAREIAEGVYGKAVDPAASGEVGDLARDFNRMSERLFVQDTEREEAERALRASELQFRSIFDGVGDAIFIHDIETGAIVDANSALTAMYGLTREQAIGADASDLSEGSPPYDAEHALELISRAAAGENPVAQWRARRKDGSLFWVEVALKRASLGGVDRILVTCRDITRRVEAERLIEASLREKETLLKEIHHRVKNNFQIINSLFDLQLMNTDDPELQEGIREPKARIHAMALIHERLYLSKDFSSIDFSDYLIELARDLFFGYNADPERIGLDIEAESISLDMDRAIPCGLILNELITNSLKYAFPDKGRRGRIAVALRRDGGSILLRVEDDGVGFKAEEDAKPRSSLGLTLARMLAEQLKGSFAIECESGVRATLVFPA